MVILLFSLTFLDFHDTIFIPPFNTQSLLQYPLTAMITPGIYKKKRLSNTSSPKRGTQFNRHGVSTPDVGGTLALRIVTQLNHNGPTMTDS
jgi:hypothetical protein